MNSVFSSRRLVIDDTIAHSERQLPHPRSPRVKSFLKGRGKGKSLEESHAAKNNNLKQHPWIFHDSLPPENRPTALIFQISKQLCHYCQTMAGWPRVGLEIKKSYPTADSKVTIPSQVCDKSSLWTFTGAVHYWYVHVKLQAGADDNMCVSLCSGTFGFQVDIQHVLTPKSSIWQLGRWPYTSKYPAVGTPALFLDTPSGKCFDLPLKNKES